MQSPQVLFAIDTTPAHISSVFYPDVIIVVVTGYLVSTLFTLQNDIVGGRDLYIIKTVFFYHINSSWRTCWLISLRS